MLFRSREALAFEATEFVNCVMTGARPTSDGETGLRIVSMLEAAERSMKDHGRPVDITALTPKKEQVAWSHSLI